MNTSESTTTVIDSTIVPTAIATKSPRLSPAMKLMNVGELEIEPGFTELWFKKENFTIVPDNKELPVLYEDLLSIPNSIRGE